MIAIRMRFLAGRLHATPWGHHVNEGVVEYPPSLFRLLRSLIATARLACQNEVAEDQLRRILTALSVLPEFHLPQAAIAHTRHYDQANSGVKFFDTFVALWPNDELLWLWREVELTEDDRIALKRLLKALGTFGRAESWCEAELLSNAETHESSFDINSRPFDQSHSLKRKDTIRLLVLQEELNSDELMKALETETSAMRKDKQLEPTGTRWVTYTRPSDILTPRRYTIRRPQTSAKTITIASYVLDSTVLPLVQDSLPFAELVRRALIRNRVGTSHSEAITGKTRYGTPLEGHSHAHYIPTDEDGDGRLDHLTIFASGGFDPADTEALSQIRTIYRGHGRPDVRLVLTGLGDLPQFTELSLFRPVKRFCSVTPFSLPRFANRGGGKKPRPRDLPEARTPKRDPQSAACQSPFLLNLLTLIRQTSVRQCAGWTFIPGVITAMKASVSQVSR